MMAHEKKNEDGIGKLNELIHGIRFAMLTSTDGGGHLHSRPMTTQRIEFDGDLWFFTGRSTSKVDEIARDGQVNVSYAAPEESRYVSISGTARVVDDHERMEDLWNPAYEAWFPDGLEDPDLVLVKVDVEEAEYWDSPSNAMVKLAGFVKGLAGGERYDGENEKIDFGRS